MLAVSLDFTADSILIEIISFGALDTGVATPDPAAEIVIELGEECGVVELFLGELHLLCGGSAGQK